MESRLKLTNRLGLPSSIVQAITNDPYSSAGSDISVTKLLTPPYQLQLLKKHAHELIEDVADRVWSLVGQVGHSIIERMPLDPAISVAEQRLFMELQVSGKPFIVSGQFDLIEGGVITDWKFTSVWSKDGKADWTGQLNLLAALCDNQYVKTGDERFNIVGTQIIAIFRDWQKAKAKIGDYPSTQVGVIPVKLWTKEERHQFLLDRVAAHTDANPAPCTDNDRWATDPVYAVMKKGRKTAVKLYAKKEEADAAAAGDKDLSVVHRPQEFKRCQAYCGAAAFCPVWQEQLAQAPF